MQNIDVTAHGLAGISEKIESTWTEYVDQEVIDAARRAVAALDNLRHILIDYNE